MIRVLQAIEAVVELLVIGAFLVMVLLVSALAAGVL